MSRVRDPYTVTIEELRAVEARIAELRDGDAIARAHLHLEERISLVEDELQRLAGEIERVPERAVTAMFAALRAANLLREPSEGDRTLGA